MQRPRAGCVVQYLDVYGHLHIPRTTVEDGVRFVEASLGYPREWRARADRGFTVDPLPRQVLPRPDR